MKRWRKKRLMQWMLRRKENVPGQLAVRVLGWRPPSPHQISLCILVRMASSPTSIPKTVALGWTGKSSADIHPLSHHEPIVSDESTWAGKSALKASASPPGILRRSCGRMLAGAGGTLTAKGLRRCQVLAVSCKAKERQFRSSTHDNLSVNSHIPTSIAD